MASELKISDMDRLITLVSSLAVMRDSERRALVLEQLHRAYGNSFDQDRFTGGSQDTWLIVKTCMDVDALSDFAIVLRMIGGPTEEWMTLDVLIKELLGATGRPHLDAPQEIKRLLATIPAEVVGNALTRAIMPSRAAPPADGETAVQAFERLIRDGNDRAAALSFLELTAHELDPKLSLELHWQIWELGRESGVGEAVEELCRSLSTPFQIGDDGRPSEPSEETSPEEDDVQTLNPTTDGRERETPGATPLVWGGVPPRNTLFTGRKNVLQDIRASLGSHTTSALVAQPLYGLGGVGKSQVAVEFAYRFQNEYELIWWIQATDDQSIRRSLASLGRRLGLPASADLDDTIETVLDALRRGDPHERWLLIYDDAAEPDIVQPYLPRSRGHVLVTSRSRTWASEAGAIELDVFTAQESISLVRRRWKSLTEDMALDLARRLGHLPLALDQAVAVHEQTGMQLDAYLRALDESPAELLSEGGPSAYAGSVAKTLRLSFDNLRSASPAAARLLELCVFLSSQPIAIQLLSRGQSGAIGEDLSATLGSDIALRRAIRDLGRYALVQVDPGRDFIRVHDLVRMVLRDRIDPADRDGLQREAHAVLAAANPRDPDDPATWHAHRQLAPHVIPSGLMYAEDRKARSAALDQVRYHYAIGDYAVSKSLGQDILEVWRTGFGADDEFTLVMSRHLANALRALGEYQRASDLNQKTLKRLTATLGVDHEHSLATANSVAADLRITGLFHEALKLDEENLERHERVLGESDPATIRVMTNLAVDYRLLGDFQRSREIDKVNLERKLQLYGQDHPRTLFAYTCLMRDLYGQGRYQEGLKLAQDKMPLYEQRLAPSHTDVLIARRHLAILLRKAGYTSLALAESMKVHDASVQKFGQEHEHALSALMTLMNCQRSSGDLEIAEKSGRAALTGYQEFLGARHPFTAACMVDTSIVLRLVGKSEEAALLADEAAAILTATGGDEHPYTLCAVHAQANGLAVANQKDAARALDERVFERSRRKRGEEHPYTLACAVNLALDLDAAGEQAASHTLRLATLERIRRVLGPNHPETANVGLYLRAESDIEVPAT